MSQFCKQSGHHKPRTLPCILSHLDFLARIHSNAPIGKLTYTVHGIPMVFSPRISYSGQQHSPLFFPPTYVFLQRTVLNRKGGWQCSKEQWLSTPDFDATEWRVCWEAFILCSHFQKYVAHFWYHTWRLISGIAKDCVGGHFSQPAANTSVLVNMDCSG